jgi:DnaJ-class molecular chaperone
MAKQISKCSKCKGVGKFYIVDGEKLSKPHKYKKYVIQMCQVCKGTGATVTYL